MGMLRTICSTPGAVTIVGSLTLPSGTPVAWQQAVRSSGLLELDWKSRAAALAALAQPVLLELLRQLVAAGWVRQSSRGSHEVPAARIVPLLGCLMGAEGCNMRRTRSAVCQKS